MSETVQAELEKIRAAIESLLSLILQIDQSVNRIEIDKGNW